MESGFPKSEIAGVQTVMPAKVTQQREVRRIFAGDLAGVGIFRRTLDVVLYYEHSNGDTDSGWLVAGWIKESLGRALTEQPLLSGRLRRRRTEEEEGDDGGVEVVANDSGVRLVEAKIPASLPEFLEVVEREGAKAEAEALFWRDIDEEDPHFSPLFYVKVTNFKCGGYSVGISCSILLADILLGTDFLSKWSEIQTSILTHQTTGLEPSKPPIFYLPTLKQDLGYLSGPSNSVSVHDHRKPSIFRVKSTSLALETFEKLALICAKEAAGAELGRRTGPDVFLFVKKEGGDDGHERLEVRSRRGGDEANEDSVCDCGPETQILRLEGYLGFREVSFWRGKIPKHSSCNVGSVSDGLVLVVPCARGEARVIVAMPP